MLLSLIEWDGLEEEETVVELDVLLLWVVVWEI